MLDAVIIHPGGTVQVVGNPDLSRIVEIMISALPQLKEQARKELEDRLNRFIGDTEKTEGD